MQLDICFKEPLSKFFEATVKSLICTIVILSFTGLINGILFIGGCGSNIPIISLSGIEKYKWLLKDIYEMNFILLNLILFMGVNLIRIGCIILSILYGLIFILFAFLLFANDFSILELMDIPNQLYLPALYYCIGYNKITILFFFLGSVYIWILYATTNKIVVYLTPKLNIHKILN